MVIFDADQSSKIDTFSDKYIYSSALPAKDPVPPETVLWDTMCSFTDQIAEALKVNVDSFSDLVVSNQTTDHHERFQNIATEIHVSLEVLVFTCFGKWLEDEDNQLNSRLFVASLKNRNKYMNYTVSNEDCNEIYLDDSLVSDIPLSISDGKLNSASGPLTGDEKIRLKFNGMNLSFIIS